MKSRNLLRLAACTLTLLAAPLSAQLNWTLVNQSAPWNPRDEHTVTNLRDTLWLLGGENLGDYFDDVWWSADGVLWNQATAAADWEARFSHAALAYNDTLWLLGGRTVGANKNDVWASTDGSHWTDVKDSCDWSPRLGHTALVFNGKMWIIGGSSNNDVWWSTDGANWTLATAAAQWSARQGHASVVFDGKMWVIGGYGWSGWKNDVWYSANGTNWIQATDSAEWLPRSNHAAVVHDSMMWVIGGDAGPSVTGAEIWKTADGVHWTRADSAAPWLWRQNLAAADFQSNVWIFGGAGHSRNYSDVWYTTGSGISESPRSSSGLSTFNFQLVSSNPFREVVSVQYSLRQAGFVRLSVHNSAGREICVLNCGNQSAGNHAADWNGRDAAGHGVARGIYFVRLNVGGTVAQLKIVKLQ